MNAIDKIREWIKKSGVGIQYITLDPIWVLSLLEKEEHEKDCPECGGEGGYHDDLNPRTNCPKCKGTGKVSTEHEKDELIEMSCENCKEKEICLKVVEIKTYSYNHVPYKLNYCSNYKDSKSRTNN